MDDKGLIDAAYTHWLDIGNTDADDAVVRERIRLHGDAVGRRIWAAYPWPFKQTSGYQIPVYKAQDGYVALPSSGPGNFQTFGSQGVVTIVGQRSTVRWIPADRMFTLRSSDTSTTSLPRFYTLSDTMFDTNGVTPPDATTPVARAIVLYPRPSENMTLQLDGFEAKLPALRDETFTFSDEPYATQVIPSQYHELCWLEGIIARLMEDEGDARAPAFEARFRQGLALAWAEERPGRNTPRSSPRYGRGRRGAWL